MGEFTPVDVITIAFSVIAAVFSLITYNRILSGIQGKTLLCPKD